MEETPSKKETKAWRREKIREITAQKKTTLNKISGILIIVVLLGFSMIAITKSIAFSNVKPQTAALANIVTPKDWTRGENQAPIELVEYINFTCENCLEANNLIQKIYAEYQSKIKITYRNFLAQNNVLAYRLAAMTEAAGLQDKFWEMHDLLFSTQSEWNNASSSAVLDTYSKKIGLDEEKFKLDIESLEVSEKITKDTKNGEIAGVKNAPTIFINNKIENIKNYEDLKTAIEKALQEKVE